jgi:hypothetical protein
LEVSQKLCKGPVLRNELMFYDVRDRWSGKALDK